MTFKTQNFPMRLYDPELTENKGYYNQPEPVNYYHGAFTMKFNVTEIEFDFDDDYAEEFKLTFDEEIEIRDLALGVWDADDEDDLIEEITARLWVVH